MRPYHKHDGKGEENVRIFRGDVAKLLIEELNPEIVVMKSTKPELR